MAQAARSYYGRSATYGSAARDMYAAPKRQPRTQPKRDVRVIPGRAKDSKRLQALAPSTVRTFKAAVAIVLLLAIVCVARVWLSVATVQAMESVTALESSIEQARDDGKDLEIQHALLASPSRIEKKAAELGMVEDKHPEHIKVKFKDTTSSSKSTTAAEDAASASAE